MERRIHLEEQPITPEQAQSVREITRQKSVRKAKALVPAINAEIRKVYSEHPDKTEVSLELTEKLDDLAFNEVVRLYGGWRVAQTSISAPLEPPTYFLHFSLKA